MIVSYVTYSIQLLMDLQNKQTYNENLATSRIFTGYRDTYYYTITKYCVLKQVKKHSTPQILNKIMTS